MCSLISINTQGLRSDDWRQTAFNFFKRHKYDIIFIQETHWTDEKQQAIQCEWDGEIIFNNGSVNACGVAILLNAWLDYHLQDIKRDNQGHILSIVINNSLLSDPILTDDIKSFWNYWLTENNLWQPLSWWDKAKQHFKRIAIPRASILRKLTRNEHTQLERNLQFLQRKATNGTPQDTENYLIAKNKLKEHKLIELKAIKICAKACFAEEGEKSTRYFYFLEKRQTNHHKTLTKDNLDTISDTRQALKHTISTKLFTQPNLSIKTRNEKCLTPIPSQLYPNESACPVIHP